MPDTTRSQLPTLLTVLCATPPPTHRALRCSVARPIRPVAMARPAVPRDASSGVHGSAHYDAAASRKRVYSRCEARRQPPCPTGASPEMSAGDSR
jgi:hypothetical protein